MIEWKADMTELVTCNCNWGCPCQFNAMPTHGNCRATAAFRIEKGHFGDTSLDGATFALLIAWPGAIHEGRGEAQLILDEKLSEDQRRAIAAIAKGEETDPGATMFSVFSNTLDTFHEPIVAPIRFEADVEGRTGRFSIPGIVEAESEPIRNPVTGAAHRIRFVMPEGFEYHEAEVANSTVKTRDKAAIALDWASGHAHFARTTWGTHGVAHPS